MRTGGRDQPWVSPGPHQRPPFSALWKTPREQWGGFWHQTLPCTLLLVREGRRGSLTFLAGGPSESGSAHAIAVLRDAGAPVLAGTALTAVGSPEAVGAGQVAAGPCGRERYGEPGRPPTHVHRGSDGHTPCGLHPPALGDLGPGHLSAHPSSRPGTGSVHEQGRSHQSGHSHSGWHSLCQTAPSWRGSGGRGRPVSPEFAVTCPPAGTRAVEHLPGRGAGSALRATQGCRCRLRFGGCKLPRGHTGSWHCNRSPRFQASRARSSYHAASLEEGPRREAWGSSSTPHQARKAGAVPRSGLGAESGRGGARGPGGRQACAPVTQWVAAGGPPVPSGACRMGGRGAWQRTPNQVPK